MKNKYYWIVDNKSSKAQSLKKMLNSIIPNNWIQDLDKSEFIFVIGGDGTFLRNKHLYNNKKIIPINGGNLGFYAYFCKKNIKTIFSKILNDNNFIYPDEIEIISNNIKSYSLNEVLIRSNKVLETKIYIDQILLENFKGTGLMFSTQLGSTAHTKNAKGAIIGPNLNVWQLLEIEPLTQKKYSSLNAALIIDSKSSIKLKSKFDNNAQIIIDGKLIENIFNNECTIKLCKANFLMFKPNHKKEYWHKLRDSFVRD